LAVSYQPLASDNSRLTALENEVSEINIRLSKLEGASPAAGEKKVEASSSDGWKYLENWRRLSTGMTYADVQKLLGEPVRIDGGVVAHWSYPSRGQVSFFNGSVERWREPGR